MTAPRIPSMKLRMSLLRLTDDAVNRAAIKRHAVTRLVAMMEVRTEVMVSSAATEEIKLPSPIVARESQI